MKYVKEVCLLIAGAAGGVIFGGISVVAAELKSKTIREAFSKTLSEKVADTLYREIMDVGKKVHSSSSVSYRDYCENRAARRINDIIFDNRSEAEKALDAMLEIKNTYGVVTVSDLCDLVSGLAGMYMDDKYGWTDLNGASVIRVRDGYMLKLPKALPLN